MQCVGADFIKLAHDAESKGGHCCNECLGSKRAGDVIAERMSASQDSLLVVFLGRSRQMPGYTRSTLVRSRPIYSISFLIHRVIRRYMQSS
jgi:hypothetical protein